jgi:hypothetical protein
MKNRSQNGILTNIKYLNEIKWNKKGVHVAGNA